MSREIEKDLDEFLDDFKEDIVERPQGFRSDIVLSKELFPDMEPPRMEVVLLDPEEATVACRRMSDPLSGEGKGDWLVVDVEELIDEALAWEADIVDMLERMEDDVEE